MLKIEETANEKIPHDLLYLADEDDEKIEEYRQTAKFWTAVLDNKIAGIIGLKEREKKVCEIVSVAVAPEHQNKKIGTRLLETAIGYAKEKGYKEILIKTGNCGIKQLYLYQSCGFRFKAIEKDYFLENYKVPIYENTIRCTDQLILSYRVYSPTEQRQMVTEYWSRFIEKNPAYKNSDYEVWCFCRGEYLPDKLIGYVKEGKKTGTSSALELYEGDEKIPENGDISVVIYGNGLPGCIIETRECRTKKFLTINEEEARLEGEGDLTLDYWRKVHEEFFRMEYEEKRRKFSYDIPVIFEQFEVIYDEDVKQKQRQLKRK